MYMPTARSFVVHLVLIGGVVASSLLPSSSASAAEVKSQAWCLGSGLQVMFEEDQARPEIRVTTIVEGGSSGEEQHGLAHVAEHLWFRSTPLGDSDVWATVGGTGGHLNGFTTRDRTTFVTTAPRSAVRTVLQLEAARISDPLNGVDTEVFDTERNIVRQELRQNYSDGGRSAFEPLYAELFPESHPYHRIPIGTEDSLAELTLEQARAYMEKWYQPANTTIHVRGAIEPDRFGELLIQSLPKDLIVHPDTGEVNGPCANERREELAVPDVEEMKLVERPLTQVEGSIRRPLSILAWTLPPTDQNLVAVDMALVEYGMETELDRWVTCEVNDAALAGVATCQFPLRDNETDEETVKELSRKAIRAAENYWSEDEMPAVNSVIRGWRTSKKAALYRSLERGDNVVAAGYFHETGEQGWLVDQLEAIDAMDPSKAMRFGREHLTRRRARVFLLKPSDVDPDALPSFHGGRESRSFEGLDPSSVDEAFLERIIGEPDFSGTKSQTLPTGLQVTVVPFGEFGVVRSQLSFPRAEDTWNLLPSVSYDEYRRLITQSGSLDQDRTDDAWKFTVDGSRLEVQLKALAEHLRNQVPAKKLNKLQKSFDEKTTARGRTFDLREELFLGEDASTTDSTTASVQSLKGKDIKNWAKLQLAPDRGHLVILGPVEPGNTFHEARKTLGLIRSKAQTAPPDRSRTPLTPERTLLAVEDDISRTQVTLTLQCRLGDDAWTSSLVSSIVETAAVDLLRREKALTYHVGASMVDDEAGHRLSLYSPVQKEGLDEAISTLDDLLKRLSEEGPSEEELAAARLNRAVARSQWLSSPRNVVDELSHYVRHDIDPTEVGGYAAALMEVDAEAVKANLAQCTGNEVYLLIGNDVGELLSEREVRTVE